MGVLINFGPGRGITHGNSSLFIFCVDWCLFLPTQKDFECFIAS